MAHVFTVSVHMYLLLFSLRSALKFNCSRLFMSYLCPSYEGILFGQMARVIIARLTASVFGIFFKVRAKPVAVRFNPYTTLYH